MGGFPGDLPDGPYRGAVGATHKANIHYTCPCGTMLAVEVYRSVDASTHPELGARLLAGDPAHALNTVCCPDTGTPVLVPVPVVYHDPGRRLLALVLSESARHRELEERAGLLAALAAEPVSIPGYVRGFAVVFGPAGLRALIEGGPRAAHDATTMARAPAGAETLAAREAALAQRQQELDARARILDTRARELDEREHRLLARERDRGEPGPEPGSSLWPSVTRAGTSRTEATMIARVGEDAIEVRPEQLGEGGVIVADQIVDGARAPLRPRPHGDDVTLVGSLADAAVAHWLTSPEPSLTLMGDRGRPRIAVRATPAVLAHLSSDGLEVRMQLHRFASGPLVVLALGTAASLSGEAGAPEPFAVLFDLDAARDRAVLEALGRDFGFTLELFAASGAGGPDQALVRRRTISGDLAGNVRYLLAAAGQEAAAGPARPRSFADSARAFAAPDYDRYGWRHPERGAFRDHELTDPSTARRVLRAMAVADRFSSPRGEAYLFLLRGYPVHQWQARRRAALARAVALGLWMGPRLAQVAVSEGLARSRRDLLRRLHQGFIQLLAGGAASDLDDDAIRDNWAALDAEAASLGESRLVVPVMSAVEQMGRSDAVRVLARVAECGPGATDALIRGLGSNKAYVRQGCALALALIGSETAVEALSDALLAEPSAVWREIARALGRVGPPAILPLASRLTHVLAGHGATGPGPGPTDDPETRARERVAWALAHVAAQGGAGQVAQLADSRDAHGAAVARRALELSDSARDDDLPVHAGRDTDGQTLQRAFSRQFFEAALATRPAAGARPAASGAPVASTLVLEEADILETAEDPGASLDDDGSPPK